jgi:hypothetical protein
VPIVTTAERMVAEAIVQDHAKRRVRATAGTSEPEWPEPVYS